MSEENKRLNKKEFSLCLIVSELGIGLLLHLVSDSDWNHAIGSPGLGVLSLHNCKDQFLKANLSLNKYGKIQKYIDLSSKGDLDLLS